MKNVLFSYIWPNLLEKEIYHWINFIVAKILGGFQFIQQDIPISIQDQNCSFLLA